MSDADRLEIHELIAKFNFTEDSGQPEAWAELFTPDGSFRTKFGDACNGREALTRFITARLRQPGVRDYVHWVDNISVIPTKDGAQAHSYLMTILHTPDGYRVRSLSAFSDQLCRHNGQWRIKARQVLPLADERAPN